MQCRLFVIWVLFAGENRILKHTTNLVAALMLLGMGSAGAQTTAPQASGTAAMPPPAAAPNEYQIVQGAAPKGGNEQRQYQQAYQTAVADFRAGRLAQAEAELIPVEQKAPNDPTVHSILGYIYLKENKSALALSEMQTVVRLAPNDPAARKNLGRAYLQLGQNSRAIAQFQSVLAAYPGDTDARYGLGLGQGQAGQNESAASSFRQVVSVRPTAGAYQNLGVVLQKGGHPAEAADAFAQAAALDPKNSVAALNAGLLYAQGGNSGKAVPALQQALALDTDYKYEAHMALGQALAKSSPDKAITEFAAAAAARPTEATPVFNQAVLQSQSGHRAEAEAAYRKVIDLAPSDPKLLADAQSTLGQMLAQDGSADGIPLLTQAVQASPGNPATHLALANLYAKTGNPQKAMAERMAALAINPGDVQTHLLVADALMAQKKYAQAAAQYDAAVQLQPGSAVAQDARGTAHELAGDTAGAQAAFEAALAADPRSARAQNNLGVVYEKQGKKTQAIAAYKKAVRLDPSLAVAHQNLARFQQ